MSPVADLGFAASALAVALETVSRYHQGHPVSLEDYLDALHLANQSAKLASQASALAMVEATYTEVQA